MTAKHRADALFVGAMVAVALLVLSHVAFVRLERAARPGERRDVDSAVRDVDAERIQRLIIEGKLSDHEAVHYRQLWREQDGGS